MIHISREYYDEFYRRLNGGEINSHLRIGQAFHQFMDLQKITGPAHAWCQRLYQADGDIAHTMINSCLDYCNECSD